nr:uncharacterized protein LOC112210395 [Halyomorpha halys]
MNRKSKKKIEVGQTVWVPRTGGTVQEAVVVFLMSVATTDSGEKDFLKVEWPDADGIVLGKTISIEDVLPRPPKAQGSITEAGGGQQGKSPRPQDKVCPICGLSFKGERGLGTHIAKKHPREANNNTLRGIISNVIGPKNGEEEISKIKEDIAKWSATFKSLHEQNTMNTADFDEAVGKFLIFLRTKKKKSNMADKGAGKVSNPQRPNKAGRSRRQEQYQYEAAQYNSYNKRKKVVQNIMNADAPKQFPLKVAKLRGPSGSARQRKNYRCDFERCKK